MQISSNIIRFPSPAALVDRQVEEKKDADKVVAFPSPNEAPVFSPESQERGQIFAAHRIVSRIADQLESFAAL